MPSGRLFIGRLSERARTEDVEAFFRDYGKIVEVVLKRGFGFVEFDDKRNAEDAMEQMNGKTLCGEHVNLEFSNRDRGYGRDDRGYGRDDRNKRNYDDRSYGDSRRGHSYRNSYGSRPIFGPYQSRYRLLVENLTTHYSWNTLMRDCYPLFTDAHKKEKHLGIVCFNSRSDLKRAMEKYQGKEINGRKIRLVDDSNDSRSRSNSRSPIRKRRSPSRSPSGSPMRKRRVPSRSPAHKRARSESRSKSPARSKRAKSRSRSASSSSRSSRSRSPERKIKKSPAHSRSRSPERKIKKSPAHSRSRSPERKIKKSPAHSRSRSSSSSRSSKSPMPKAEMNGHRSRSATSSSNKSHSVEKEIKGETD
ncbi:RNA recognition motif domain-containing protein [Ditylenchus destructor]|nr:RNA recognition motif domain-containing protein [Ditylenchus destructor]